MVGAANGKPRLSFSPSNGEMENSPSNAESESTADFTRDDVDSLLSEKMRYKSKFNYKERCELMQDYIRRLRICVRWFQDLESSYLFDQEKLRTALALAEIKHADAESTLKRKEDELNSTIFELRHNLENVEKTLASEQTEKSSAISALSEEKEARVNAEVSLSSANKEITQLNIELQSANQRIVAVNDMYKLLQEYNASLQVYNSKLQADLDSAHETVKRGEKEKASMVESLGDLRLQFNSLLENYNSCKESMKEITVEKDEMGKEILSLKENLQNVKEERDTALNLVTSLRNEVSRQEERISKSKEIEERFSLQCERLKAMEIELEEANNRLKESDLSTFRTQSEFEAQKELISELEGKLESAEIKLVEGEKVRKKLHNTILELKGNIRVFCRVRPLLPDFASANDTNAVSYPTATEVLGRGLDLSHNGQTYSYTYDKVFGHESTQEDVFLEVSQLVQSALDGYKVCIFAYGQTGSGKTYTMMGKPGDPTLKGLIPRSLEQIFETRQTLQSQGWKYEMQVSMLEIYNESIRDLLAPRENGKQYTIKHDNSGNTHVSDLTVVDVRSSREVAFLLDQAAHSRSVGKTQINEHSSRSHFVFTLRITGVNAATDQQVNGVLNLIDLAGSERLSKSGSTGDRLKETQAINKSLSSLSDVIFALAKREDHIPFRNSKLTYLLQPCLGGDSKTLMVVNISPENSSGGESLCSLRFACRVNACEIGTPRRQTNSRLSLG